MQKYHIHKLIIFLWLAIVVSACLRPENPNEDKDTKTVSPNNISNRTVDQQIQPDNSEKPEKTGGENDTQGSLRQMLTQNKPFILHVPPQLDPEKNHPVIFIFDPHARGSLPVNKYSNLADEFGFVLIGSNQSMNNQPIEDGLKYYYAMKSGIEKEVAIDAGRIYTMGFSGGARVAVSIAIQNSEVQGVIGCGAGFPAVTQVPQPDFYYFGIVGYEDFNMGELINNDRLLARSGFENELVIFDGGHKWPSEEIMREAFLALEIDHLAKSSAQKQSIINQAIDYYSVAIGTFTSEDRYFDAAEMADRAASVLSRIGYADDFKSQGRNFKKNPAYRQDLSAMVKTMEKEPGLQNSYMAAFNDKDAEWWKAEITILKTPVDEVFDQRLNKRLESFVGLMAYMQSTKAIADDNLDIAQKSLDIYRLIEPVNPEHAYLGAVVSMKLGDEKTALGYLEQAVVLGFNNIERLQKEEVFDDFAGKDEIIGLIQGTP